MSDSTIRHFDYLIDHDAEFEYALELTNLPKKIDRCRCDGMEEPDLVLSESRKIMETALRKLTEPLPDERMNLKAVIEHAEDMGLLNKPMFYKCDAIRKLGNEGSHKVSVREVDARQALELLDDFLRWCAEYLQLIPPHSEHTVCAADDPIFISKTTDEVNKVARRAKLASALSGNKSIEKKAKEAKTQASTYDSSVNSNLQKMEELIKQAEIIGEAAAEQQDEATLAAQQRLFDGLQANIETIKSEKQEIDARFNDVGKEVDEILNEHDFVNRLLHGNKHATEDQLAIMAFPKGSNSSTNILQVAGGAGTGKTLCLLAKIISEVDDHGQTELFDSPKKKALFVCFNKGLANYVKEILSSYKESSPSIDVIHYDRFVNQLVKPRPDEEFSSYAKDVRYPSRNRIVYGSDKGYEELLESAQTTIAERYPSQANEYYLNPPNEDELDWVKDELLWIEARFKDEHDATLNYPKAARVGRGTKHMPREAARRVILEVWTELNRLLKENDRYTIEQATKKLLESNQLPAYDAIAIDEVQDFSLLSIKLLLHFRKSQATKVFISGDENQKIYRRDFTWKELDEDLTGHTITLHENKRNSNAIESFSNRLLGNKCTYEEACHWVNVKNVNDERLIELLKVLENEPEKTTALIGSKWKWEKALEAAGIPIASTEPDAVSNGSARHGLYLIGNFEGKGLEFDNVVVDYFQEVGEDEEEEKRLRYVHFTRARRRLYIRYQGTPPKLLTEYYADFLDRG